MKRENQILYHLLDDFHSERTDAGLHYQFLIDLEVFCQLELKLQLRQNQY